MLASEVIAELQKLISEHGDRAVVDHNSAIVRGIHVDTSLPQDCRSFEIE